MLLDTGSAVSVVSEDYYQKNLNSFPLKPAPRLRLKSYSGQNIAVRGCVMIPVQYETQRVTLPLVIVKGNRPALIGRELAKRTTLELETDFHSAQGANTSRVDPRSQPGDTAPQGSVF